MLNTEEKKQRIIEVAKDHFERFGYKKTAVDEIASRAKVGKGTIYELFGNKEGLLIAVFTDEAFKIQQYVFYGVDQEKDIRGKLGKMLRRAFSYYGKNQFMLKIMRDDSAMSVPALWRAIQEGFESGMVDILKSMLAEGLKDGSIAEGLDPDVAALVLLRIFEDTTYALAEGVKGISKKRLIEGTIDIIRRMTT